MIPEDEPEKKLNEKPELKIFVNAPFFKIGKAGGKFKMEQKQDDKSWNYQN